jgi:hypothetical protein
MMDRHDLLSLFLWWFFMSVSFVVGFEVGKDAPMNQNVWECTELAIVDDEPGCNVWRRRTNDN